MDPEQILEYRQLQHEMVTRLRHHGFVDDVNAYHVFQYLILPSFSPPIAWDVFRRRREGKSDDTILIRSTWRSDLDLEKLRSPIEQMRHPHPLLPTVEVHQLTVAPETLQQIEMELKSMHFSIGTRERVGGVDGVFYEIAIEQPPHHLSLAAKCRLSWWCQPPTEWASLAAWVRRAEATFDVAWNLHGNAEPIPLKIKAINDAENRVRATRLFREGRYSQAAQVLSEISTREKLSPSEAKMLELALTRRDRDSTLP